MNKLTNVLLEMGHIEQLSTNTSVLHMWHPLLKMLGCLMYLVVVISTPYLHIISLLLLGICLYVLVYYSRIPFIEICKRSLLGVPMALCIGIPNLFLMKDTIMIFDISLTNGFISLLSLILKNGLCLSAVFLLIGTTGFDTIASQLVKIKVPAIFVLQLMMIYRYIFLLVEEARDMTQAYILKNPHTNAIAFKDIGMFMGSLLVRSFKRSEEVYQAMKCRGFDMYYTYQDTLHWDSENYFLLLFWIGILLMIRVVF
jgi:cobalt/nickel transport system permease protein